MQNSSDRPGLKWFECGVAQADSCMCLPACASAVHLGIPDQRADIAPNEGVLAQGCWNLRLLKLQLSGSKQIEPLLAMHGTLAR
jgi:hypothetical protein